MTVLERLKDWLYELIVTIARIHDEIVSYNSTLSAPFDDKQMHFIVIGGFGLLLFLAILPLFIFLTRKNRPGLMAWLFSFMTVLYITFAIEIGQKLTDTGGMELADIVYGVVGFLAVSAVLGFFFLLYLLIRMLLRK